MTSYVRSTLSKGIFALINLSRLRESVFFKNVLLLMSATGMAQLIAFVFSPILSRLYGPVDFGSFGSFTSVVGILSAAVTLQYAEAILLPGKDEEAAGLFVVACFSALAISGAFGVLCCFFPGFWLIVLKAPELKGWLWLIPLSALVIGVNKALTFWCTRRKAFKRTAAVQVVRSLTASGGQTAAGLAGCGGGGLIGGGFAGEVLANMTLWRWVIRGDGGLLRGALTAARVKSAARDYKDFPFFSAPQNLMNAASQGAPVILLIFYYGAAVGGLYAFSVRVLQVPMNFVLTSLRQVLFQKLTEVHNGGGDLARLFKKCTGTLLAVAFLPAIVGFFFAPRIFAFVFGIEWMTAGEYARWLLVWCVPAFCNLPAALLARILRRQGTLLLFDLALLIARVVVLVLGGVYFAPIHTVAAFSLVGAGFNTFLILYVWRLLKLHTFSNTAGPGRVIGADQV